LRSRTPEVAENGGPIVDARRRRGCARHRVDGVGRPKFDVHTGRNGTDMWMKDQYLDILFRWLYLPLYILFASFSLNF